MKILLINSNRYKYPWPVIPYGLCAIASSLEAAGHEVNALDLCFSSDPAGEIGRAISGFNPELVGVSIRNIDNGAGHNTTFLLDKVRDETIAPLKMHYNGPVVIGGPAVGVNGVEMLHYFDLGLAVKGDGELAVTELARRLESDTPLNGLPGLVRRVNGEIVEENPPWPAPDLDALPRVSLKKFVDLEPYAAYDSPLQIQTKRGCPLGCSYCTYNIIEGRQYRLRDPDRVAAEIEILSGESGTRRIEITDSTFNLPLDHAKKVLQAIIGRNLGLRIRTMGINPGAVDEELVDLMLQAGFRDVDLGAESLSDGILERLGKNYSKADVIKAGRLLKKYGIPTSWMLMVGGPGETADTLKETFETAAREASRWDLICVAVGVRLYKGAPLANEASARGWEGAADGFFKPTAYHPDELSLEEVRALTKRAWYNYRNFLIYSEDMTFPEDWLRQAGAVLRRIAPDAPLWKIYIVSRLLEKYCGLDLPGRIRHYLDNRAFYSSLARRRSGLAETV